MKASSRSTYSNLREEAHFPIHLSSTDRGRTGSVCCLMSVLAKPKSEAPINILIKSSIVKEVGDWKICATG